MASRKELAEFRQRTEERIAAEKQAEHLKDELRSVRVWYPFLNRDLAYPVVQSLEALQTLPAEELEVLVMNSFEAGGIISSSS